MTATRREFLTASAAAAAGLTLGGPFVRSAQAKPEREIAMKPALIVLFLRGGQDCLNTLVPYSDGRYYDLRPNIAVPPPDRPDGAIDLDGTFGLNPALTGFKKLWDEKLLAPVCCAGLGHPSRSHFACQDYMEYGALGDKSVRSGWLNRFLAATSPRGPEGEFRAVALQARLPRSLRGTYPVLAAAGVRGRRGGEDVLDLFDDLYKDPAMDGPPPPLADTMEQRPATADDLTANGKTTIETLRKLDEILATKAAGHEANYPATLGRLGQQFKMAARVLKSGQGVEVIGMDWNGWDHHIREGGSKPADLIFRMNKVLGDTLATFYEDVKFMKNKVTTIIMTEFGRTNRENGNFGTDHGHGGAMYVVGGSVAGGKVYGDWTGLAPGRSYQNRDLLVTTDWRQVFSETLHTYLRLHPSKQLFKGFTPSEEPLGLFKAR